MMVSVSYIEVTARGDFPTVGRKDLHLWEPTLQTLAKQTFKDFEYIVVDLFYDERKDYFKGHDYGLKIKHIPAGANAWSELGLVQICHQFNTGIVNAEGELLFFGADSGMYPPNLFANLWKHHQEGYFVSLGFGSDVTYASKGLLDYARTNVVPTEWYKFLGFEGYVLMDHRYNKSFEGNSVKTVKIPHSWYYGISTVSLEAALKINGFDEAFDADGSLNDVDFGARLDIAGYRNLIMCRDCYTVEAYAGTDWHHAMKRIPVKCNHGLYLSNMEKRRLRVNEPLSEQDVERIFNICASKCNVRQKCQEMNDRAPFYYKSSQNNYELWKKHVTSFSRNLRDERLVLNQEGTFIGC